jgi:putative ABC transport system permease protein
VTKAGNLSPAPPAFAQEQIGALQSLPEVQQASGVMSELMGIENAPIVLVFGWESNTFVWDHLRLVSGRWPRTDAEQAVVLGSFAIDVLQKTVGSSIQIGATTFAVCGIFESASLVENGAVVMTLPQLQSLTEQPGKVNFVNVKLVQGTTTAQTDSVRRSIMTRFPGFKAYTAGQASQNNTAIQVARALSWTTSAIALLVGALGVMNTMLMSVFERLHEMGILLAVGWRRSRIVRLILCESIVLTVTGGLLGVGSASAGMLLLQRMPLLRGKIQGDFSPLLFAIAFAVAVGLGLIGGLYPAYRGSRLRPIDALRHE